MVLLNIFLTNCNQKKYVLEKQAWNIGSFNNYYQNELNYISEICKIRYRFDRAVLSFIVQDINNHQNMFTMVTHKSCPSWFTPPDALSSKPVTNICYVTVDATSVSAVHTIVTWLTCYNSSFKHLQLSFTLDKNVNYQSLKTGQHCNCSFRFKI